MQSVEKAVRGLGYEIAAVSDRKASPHEHGDHDHSDHAKPIEGAWWESSKGLLVIVTAVMIGLAYLERSLLPYGSQFVFLAAAVVGTFPVAKRAFAALRAGSLFTIEMLMTIAVIGAVAIGAIEHDWAAAHQPHRPTIVSKGQRRPKHLRVAHSRRQPKLTRKGRRCVGDPDACAGRDCPQRANKTPR